MDDKLSNIKTVFSMTIVDWSLVNTQKSRSSSTKTTVKTVNEWFVKRMRDEESFIMSDDLNNFFLTTVCNDFCNMNWVWHFEMNLLVVLLRT